MAEYQDRTGYNVGITGGAGGSEPPDTIEAQWVRKLERDVWVRFWGPGVACSDWDDNSEYDRATGWNQSASYDAGTAGTGTTHAGMGDISGNPDSHLSAGSGISTSDPRDAFGYGKYTVRANISAVNQSTSCQLTCVGHGLLDETHEGGSLSVPNYIQIVGVPSTSMHQLNEQYFYAKVVDADTLQLFNNEDLDDPYDSSGNSQWVGTEGYINFVVDFVEGTGDAGNYEKTTTIARDQYIALQKRVNTAIYRTGQSTVASGNSRVLLDLVTKEGAMRKGDTTPTTDINQDMGRVRAAHVNKLSDEIEHIGSPLNNSSLGAYNFHKMHVNGIYAPNTMNNHEALVYDDQVSQTGLWQWDDAWGSDTWSSSSSPGATWPWTDSGGSNYGRDRPFIEARMMFNNWAHMRYWFNQGGCCLFHPNFDGDGSMGGWMWQNLAKANNPVVQSGTSMVFAGQYAPYYENGSLISSGHITFRQGGSGTGWGVTGDCPRVHGFGDKTPAAYFGGGGGATSDGTTITGLTTTYMAQGDILHLGDWMGEIDTATGGTATLYRKIRKIDQTEYDPDPTNGDGPLSSLDWACSKWYRACQYDGNQGLYGDEGNADPPTFPNNETKFGDNQGYIHFDWRFVKDPSTPQKKPCIFYRMMYDNTGTNCTVHGTGKMELGSRRPSTIDYFYPEQGATPPVITNDKASTAEGHDGFNRINDGTTANQ